MNFKDVELKTEYRSKRNDIVEEFYIPILEKSVNYKRAVGFFTSTALIEISKGITGLVKNNGKIKLIASPRLSPEDVEAMRVGYERRNQIIEKALIRGLGEAKGNFEKESLNLLANLIAEEVLDIKISFIQSDNDFGMYHEKMGIVSDHFGNKIAFSGSNNETKNAMRENYETLDVFCSWEDSREQNRIIRKEQAFDNIWNGIEQGIETVSVPNLKDEIIKKYLTESLAVDREDVTEMQQEKNYPRIPSTVKLYDYQKEAIDKWMEREALGIFDMATGSGKTFTGLGAIVTLSRKLNGNLGVIIVCPYQHLVEQWVEDIRFFGVEPLICYSKYPGWDKKFKSTLSDFRLGVIDNFCVIVSNASFSLPKMQEQLAKIKPKENICLVVDEAHNVGSVGLQEALPQSVKYRLALSATIERHRDEEGTKAIYDYFGEKCIEFSLKDAIDNGFLTPYKYYPIVVTLNDDELQKYMELSKKIFKLLRGIKDGEKMPHQAQVLLIKRAKIIAGASSKLEALKKAINPYKNKNNILVYCGATKVDNEEIDYADERQIEAVTKILGNDLNMKVSMFTSKEDNAERVRLKEGFSDGSVYQALIAIKCLDEGVNIPGIRTAFILASSTNPKEYIQRRGRVLRKAKGKSYAEIFDFIVLPRDLYGSSRNQIVDINSELSLVKRELERVEDFMALADNASESYQLRDQINEYYKTNCIGGKDYGV